MKPHPVIGRIENGSMLLDLQCLAEPNSLPSFRP
jgi:hypothetical protein